MAAWITRSSSEQPNASERSAPIEADPVGGVVDRAQDDDQVADLLALEVVAAALVAVGDRRRRAAPPRRPRARPAREEDRDVAPDAPVGSRRCAVAHGPALPCSVADGVLQQRGDRRPPPRPATRDAALALGVGSQHDDRWPAELEPAVARDGAFSADVRRLEPFPLLEAAGRRSPLTHSITRSVERKFWTRSRAGPRRGRRASPRRRCRCRRGGSGRSTASDRRRRRACRAAACSSRQLRFVALRLRAVAACEQQRDLRLDRVGVLELVDQQRLEAPLEVARAPRGGPAAGRAPRSAGRRSPRCPRCAGAPRSRVTNPSRCGQDAEQCRGAQVLLGSVQQQSRNSLNELLHPATVVGVGPGGLAARAVFGQGAAKSTSRSVRVPGCLGRDQLARTRSAREGAGRPLSSSSMQRSLDRLAARRGRSASQARTASASPCSRRRVVAERQEEAVAVEHLGGLAQLVEVHAEVEGALDVLGCSPSSRSASHSSKCILEGERGLDVAHHRELGVEAGLDRPLAQEARGEGVDRLDPGPVKAAMAASIRARALGVALFLEGRSSASRTRAESSAAAFSVKVITTRLSTSACPLAIRLTMRLTSEVVLPVPAPASTQMLRVELVADLVADRPDRPPCARRLAAAITRSPSSAPAAGRGRRRPFAPSALWRSLGQSRLKSQ